MAGLLNDNIQGHVAGAREILAHLDAVELGREAIWSQSGNAYVITIKPHEAVLDFHWGSAGKPNTASIPLSELRMALIAWIAALTSRNNST